MPDKAGGIAPPRLGQQGFEGVKSMASGIDAWSREIDSTVPRY